MNEKSLFLFKINKMLTKENVLQTINKFPNSFSLDDLIDELIFIEKVEKGLKDSAENKVNTEAEAKEKLAKWLK
jgi:hypothetical protein